VSRQPVDCVQGDVARAIKHDDCGRMVQSCIEEPPLASLGWVVRAVSDEQTTFVYPQRKTVTGQNQRMPFTLAKTAKSLGF
jgi:hypothetical protein